MKKIFLLFCFSGRMFFSPPVDAQQKIYDSVWSVVQSSKDDTNKLKLLGSLANNSPTNQKAMEHAQQGLKLAQKLHHEKFIVTFIHHIGNIYYNEGNYSKSLEYYMKELKIVDASGNKRRMASAYNGLGNVYSALENFEKAIEYYTAGLTILDSFGEKYNENKLSFYNNLGIAYSFQKNYNKALEYFMKVLKATTDPYATGDAYSNIGDVYFVRRSYEVALDYYNKALKKFEIIGMKPRIASAYNNIGKANMKMTNYEQAMRNFNQAVELARKTTSNEVLAGSYESLSAAHAFMGNYKESYEYHKLYSEVKDTLFNETSSRQITEMQTKYETEKKEQEIVVLNKDKEIQQAAISRQQTVIWFVVCGLLLVVILSAFIFRERKKSEKLLLNILPAETARELKRNGKAKAKHYENVTVMFADFKNFTAIAEKLSAEELVSELDFLFKKFDEIISKYPIEKIKTIGDAYMCAGGLPTVNNTHARDVVSAALEIQNFMKELAVGNKQLANGNPNLQTANWQLRIGIHTGPVIAGVVGAQKFAYDIWGDTVNTASRMESSGEAGKINISGATYKLITESVSGRNGETEKLKFEFRGKVKAKNKGDVEMYFVEREFNY